MRYAIALLGASLMLAACGVPEYQSRGPSLRVERKAGCPAALNKAQDVENPGLHTKTLLPDSAPTAGLLCAYGGDNRSTAVGALIASRRFGATIAESLETAINAIKLGERGDGDTSCPNDDDRDAVLVFSYRDAADVDLWWHSTGCELLDNGRKIGTEGGNPSFYSGFFDAVAAQPGLNDGFRDDGSAGG